MEGPMPQRISFCRDPFPGENMKSRCGHLSQCAPPACMGYTGSTVVFIGIKDGKTVCVERYHPCMFFCHKQTVTFWQTLFFGDAYSFMKRGYLFDVGAVFVIAQNKFVKGDSDRFGSNHKILEDIIPVGFPLETHVEGCKTAGGHTADPGSESVVFIAGF